MAFVKTIAKHATVSIFVLENSFNPSQGFTVASTTSWCQSQFLHFRKCRAAQENPSGIATTSSCAKTRLCVDIFFALTWPDGELPSYLEELFANVGLRTNRRLGTHQSDSLLCQCHSAAAVLHRMLRMHPSCSATALLFTGHGLR
eukprot:1957516-Amphidinium_carterae.1